MDDRKPGERRPMAICTDRNNQAGHTIILSREFSTTHGFAFFPDKVCCILLFNGLYLSGVRVSGTNHRPGKQ